MISIDGTSQSFLKEKGWKRVLEEDPPKGENILMGELVNGDLNCFHTEVSKPFKRMGVDNYYYSKDGQYHVLRTDLYWKDL